MIIISLIKSTLPANYSSTAMLPKTEVHSNTKY